jgi:hypothetical protein
MELTLAHPNEAVADSHASVSGELADLLIELASGLRRACVYGPRHPTVQEAAKSFVTTFSSRRRDRGTLAIAVAGSHLIVEVRPAVKLTRHLNGVTSGLEHPLLGALADRLRTHEVGEIVLAEGVTEKEIASILGFLSTDPSQTERPLGCEPEEALQRLPNVKIHRDETTSGVLAAPGATRSPEEDARLWSGFARAALAIPQGEEKRPYAPAEVAAAIAARCGNDAFARSLAAHAVQVSSSLGQAGPLESMELRRRFSDVLRRLDRATLKVVLRTVGDLSLMTDFLLDSASALEVDVVFDLIQAAGEDDSADISRWMLRLLSKLAKHAESAEGPVSHRSEEALRGQIHALLSGWDLENPNPEDYEEELARMSLGTGHGANGGAERSGIGDERTLAMALEVGVDGPVVRRAVDRLIETRRIPTLVERLDSAPHADLALSLWSRLAERPVLYRLIEEEEPDWGSIDLILPHARIAAAEPLLDRLAEADSLAIRRRLFDRLGQLGPEVGAAAVRCIGEASSTPWYVLRNVLSLLAMLESWPEGFDPWPLADHENSQVRLEAVKLCLRMPANRDRAILKALRDGNSRIAALGIVEAERGCPAEGESYLVGIALDSDGEFAEFRTHAIRALAGIGTPGALAALLEITAPRRRGLRRVLPDGSPELLAALSALASQWPDAPEAREVLDLAGSSGRPSIRKAVQ